MSFRAKLKKTFGKKSKLSEDSPSGDSSPPRDDIEYYEPHETPKSKYRGRVDPEHHEMLHAFSFAAAFGRRASSRISNAFSPGQSRRASTMSVRRRKSNVSGKSDRDSKSLRRRSVVPSQARGENDAEATDVANAGLTQHGTTATLKAQADVFQTESTLEGSSTRHDTPFTPEELERAITAASLKMNGE